MEELKTYPKVRLALAAVAVVCNIAAIACKMVNAEASAVLSEIANYISVGVIGLMGAHVSNGPAKGGKYGAVPGKG